MEILLTLLITPLKIFAFNPIAAFLVAIIFTAACFLKFYSGKSRKILTLSAVIWWLYSFFELYMTTWRSPTGDMAIRIDLVLFGPIILFVGIVGLITLLIGWKLKA